MLLLWKILCCLPLYLRTWPKMLRSLKILQLCTSVPPYLAKNVAPLENFGLCTSRTSVPRQKNQTFFKISGQVREVHEVRVPVYLAYLCTSTKKSKFFSKLSEAQQRN